MAARGKPEREREMVGEKHLPVEIAPINHPRCEYPRNSSKDTAGTGGSRLPRDFIAG